MKTAIIVVLCIIIAFGGGLLIYGATRGEATTLSTEHGELLPPENPAEFAHGIAVEIETRVKNDSNRGYAETFFPETNPSKDPAIFAAEVDGWYDVFGKSDPSTSILTRYSGADLVGNLLVPITYNNNRSKQFCMVSHYEIKASGSKIVSDNLRVRVQVAPFAVDGVYLSRAWAGSSSSSAAGMTVYYNDQQLSYKMPFGAITDYDEEKGEYDMQIGKPKKESRDRDLDREVPYKTYDLLNFPIYLGGADKNDNSPLDSSVVLGSSVNITAPTEEKPYYTLTFSEDLQKAQTSRNLNDRLNAALGEKMSNITLKKADFTVEIWESGVFRQLSAKFTVNAKINGKQGDAEVDMSYKFYYDNKSCDIFALIEQADWVKYLSAANKTEFDQRKAAWITEK